MNKIKYDTKVYPFRELIQQHFGFFEDLSRLHEYDENHSTLVVDFAGDQRTKIHKHFYKMYDENPEFLSLYRKLLKEVILPQYGDMVYQTRPTFRMHYPNNIAVGEWHKDGDYRHPKTEMNYWMPFTKAFGNNTIWIESEEDKGDYQPYEVDYGEILVFKGVSLRHGNKVNDTGKSRVSVDFRIIAFSDYEESSEASNYVKLKFAIGGYYERMGS